MGEGQTRMPGETRESFTRSPSLQCLTIILALVTQVPAFAVDAEFPWKQVNAARDAAASGKVFDALMHYQAAYQQAKSHLDKPLLASLATECVAELVAVEHYQEARDFAVASSDYWWGDGSQKMSGLKLLTEKARQYYEKGLRETAQASTGVRHYANSSEQALNFRKSGELQNCVVAIKQHHAIAILPSEFNKLARVYEMSGDLGQAKVMYQHALELCDDSNSTDCIKAKQRLRSIMANESVRP